jgi:hypothetical protein
MNITTSAGMVKYKVLDLSKAPVWQKGLVWLWMLCTLETVSIFRNAAMRGRLHLPFWDSVILAIIMAAVMFLLHEAMHGLFFWRFTGKAQFGFRIWTGVGPIFWATSPGYLLSKSRMALTALAPQFLSVICFGIFVIFNQSHVLVAYCAALFGAFDLAGGGGDLWALIKIGLSPNGALIEDTRDNSVVWIRPDAAKP